LNEAHPRQPTIERGLFRWTGQLCLAVALTAAGATGSGCKQNPSVVPVTGLVLYNDKPLPFGTVMFQPDKGQPAIGEIRNDGSFTLTSYVPEDGAVPGRHLVSITCYEGQRPGQSKPNNSGETSLGKLLIPLKYTRTGSSGLTAQIENAPGQSVELKLTGPPVKF
jgi:hypothetical protein